MDFVAVAVHTEYRCNQGWETRAECHWFVSTIRAIMTATQSISLVGGEGDELLMQRYASGDIQAFDTLYRRHKGGLYRYFLRQIGDSQLAEDLYQETWGRVIKAAPAYEISAKFTTWLYRIAHNLLIDHVRAVKPLNEADTLDEEGMALTDSMTPVRSHEHDLKVQALKHCVGLLPQVQKEAFQIGRAHV